MRDGRVEAEMKIREAEDEIRDTRHLEREKEEKRRSPKKEFSVSVINDVFLNLFYQLIKFLY